MLSEIKAGLKAAESGETAAGIVLNNRRRRSLFRTVCSRVGQQNQRPSFEQFFGRNCETVRDLGRAIEDFQDVIAERAVKFARGSVPRGQFDPAKASIAFGADDIAFSHAGTMHADHHRSKTAARA
jgi:hypothetical protein